MTKTIASIILSSLVVFMAFELFGPPQMGYDLKQRAGMDALILENQ